MTADKTGNKEMMSTSDVMKLVKPKSKKRKKRDDSFFYGNCTNGKLGLKASKKNAKGVVNHKSRLLLDWLAIQRPYGSQHEINFTYMLYQKCVGQLGCQNVEQDNFGNVIAWVGDGANVLFSAHTDTVHHEEGMQTVCVDLKQNFAFTKDGSCLGSDDATGCYILWRMIEAGVPGVYIFHRGEEVGGLGSEWLAKNRPEIFKPIDMAVAFDRRGTDDIITSQAGGDCASGHFADSLTEAFGLANPKLIYSEADGVFTDTANYTRLVAECTNISCGYYDEHTPDECQDLGHLEELIKACVVLPWSELVVVRNPMAADLDGMMEELGGYYGSGDDLAKMVELVKTHPVAAAALLVMSEMSEHDFYGMEYMEEEFAGIQSPAQESDSLFDSAADQPNYLQRHVADLLDQEEILTLKNSALSRIL